MTRNQSKCLCGKVGRPSVSGLPVFCAGAGGGSAAVGAVSYIRVCLKHFVPLLPTPPPRSDTMTRLVSLLIF